MFMFSNSLCCVQGQAINCRLNHGKLVKCPYFEIVFQAKSCTALFTKILGFHPHKMWTPLSPTLCCVWLEKVVECQKWS
jgi:hypothetical protein